MHLFDHFSVTLPHGFLQKFHHVSAVAMDHREGVFAQIRPHVLKGQVEAVATETTKLRDHQEKSKLRARLWLAVVSLPVIKRWDSR